jgi:uncharacterized damage-inducible protein DinB
MPDFDHADLKGSRFVWTDLSDSEFIAASLSGVRIRGTDLHNVVMTGVELLNVSIYGELQNVTINGVDVWPLVDAELNRRYPDRVKMRPTDPAGFREAWDVVERLWSGTVERARGFPPEQLHESVAGEWSFIQTLRHLAFASESWVGRCVLGDPSPWHAMSLPWDQMAPREGVPHDRDARPPLEAALALRLDAMALVRHVVDGLDDEELDRVTDPLVGPGWPDEGSTFVVRECLLIVLNEEWHHRLYAERDLAVLEERD